MSGRSRAARLEALEARASARRRERAEGVAGMPDVLLPALKVSGPAKEDILALPAPAPAAGPDLGALRLALATLPPDVRATVGLYLPPGTAPDVLDLDPLPPLPEHLGRAVLVWVVELPYLPAPWPAAPAGAAAALEAHTARLLNLARTWPDRRAAVMWAVCAALAHVIPLPGKCAGLPQLGGTGTLKHGTGTLKGPV